MLTTNQEIAATLITEQTLYYAIEQFDRRDEIIEIESFDMSFRLYRATDYNINLEMLLRIPIGTDASKEDVDIEGLGKGVIQEEYTFYKPVGFYTNPNSKDFDNDKLDLYVLHEFQEDLNFISAVHNIPDNVSIHTLSIRENAVVAAFSMETYLQALKIYEEISEKGFQSEINKELRRVIPAHVRFDKRFLANGLESELLLTFEGFPQFFLDDDYNLKGPIAAFMRQADGVIMLNPIVEHEEQYKRFLAMGLLTGCKK